MASPETATPPVPPARTPSETPLAWRAGLTALVLALGGAAYFGRESLTHGVRAAMGIVAFIAVVAAASHNLRAIRVRTIAWGIGLQFLFAFFVLKFAVPGRPEGMPLGTYASHLFTLRTTQDVSGADVAWFYPGYEAINAVANVVTQFLGFTNVGSEFVFGKLADGGAVEKVFGPGRGFIFAFQALPTIIFVSSFFTVLYYFGVLQFIVRIMAKAMMHMMGTSGAESLSAVANVFMGQTEAPLIVKPYVPRMTRSELLAMMVGGMATISGGVMAVYINLGADATAILATSVMAAPCGLYLAKLMWPETENSETSGNAEIKSEKMHSNVIDAAAGGASDGMMLALNVAAMIIAFLAFITLIDALLGSIKPGLIWAGASPEWEMMRRWPDNFSLATIFSTIFYPVALLMGSDVKDAPMIADLLGTKLVTNEFVSYVKLTTPAAENGYHDVISPMGLKLATYALTGFANIASIGIQLGGIGSMAPTRRADLAALGGRALLCGFLATLINASIAGLFMR